ncbi:hypothetical protein HX004_13225 [Myroides sp. 1354]|uniref:hypothetical protein n=1 Tax=unclassified Myroides TaxID=2642485 RepID=UPI002578CA6A|nr:MULTISPECIES: hypothetical protein [unclassified Myroides]MDM1045732.1 hypothetical protein [Myroides sp. R163-1]MDM1056734.1 hypothetical protein [Myroides sp. 1354]MDM1070527.1 hypothetical protein [Myroides sp. 1372]
MKKLILQPFVYAQEKQLLLIGLSMAFLGCLLQLTKNVRLFSSLQVKSVPVPPTLLQSIADFGISTFALTLTLFILGYYINAKTRLVDIFNTVLIAKLALSPLLIIPLDYAMDLLNNLEEQVKQDQKIGGDYLVMFLHITLGAFVVLLCILFSRYLYQGFKTATHVKKNAHLILFVLLVLLVELCIPSLTNLY